MDNPCGRRRRLRRAGGREREILALAVPAFGALVAEPLFLLGDAWVVARLGTAQLAGVAVAGTVLSTVVGLCVFLAYGTTAAVARRFGAGDRAGAVRDGSAGLWLAVLLGVVLVAVLEVLDSTLLGGLGVVPETAGYAQTYLSISVLGLPAMLLVLAGTGVRRGLQDTRTPLVVSVAAAVLNLGLAATLVLGLGLGVAGSAWATVITQVLAALVYVQLVRADARRASSTMRPATGDVLRAVRSGAALFVRTAALRAVLLVSLAVAARLGMAEVAAYQLAFLTWNLLALALDALAIAAQAIVGRNLGAGDVVGTRAATRTMVAWGVWAGAVLGVGVLVARPLFGLVFDLEPAVASALSAALVVVAVHQPVAGPVFVLDGVLIGAGDNRWLAWAQLVVLAAYLPVASAVPRLWDGTAGLVALWVALLWFLVLRLVLLSHRAHTDAWLVTGAQS